jgi:hypothetical protein
MKQSNSRRLRDTSDLIPGEELSESPVGIFIFKDIFSIF